MWYWDHIPSGGQHSKKPLTKWQIKKLQQAYEIAGAISQSFKSLEEVEQEIVQREVEDKLKLFF